jgi:hypothetical protein
MIYSDVPQVTLVKLLQLDGEAQALVRQQEACEAKVDDLRRRYNGAGSRSEHNSPQLREQIETLMGEHAALAPRARTEMSVLSNCKVWLDRLPADTKLQPVDVTTDGYTLAGVRENIHYARQEIATIKAAAIPAHDIQRRVTAYVEHLAAKAKPVVQGLGADQRLAVLWPIQHDMSRVNLQGYDEANAHALMMIAACAPEQLTARIMEEIAIAASTPLPVAERAPRIAELQRKVEGLAYIEEALVAVAIANGEPVCRRGEAPPAAVLLVKVVAAEEAIRAA